MSSAYQSRQEDELMFLREIFPAHFEDLRCTDPWKMNRPPEIRVKIVPEKSTDLQDKLFAVLRAKYPVNYPDDVPELTIEDCRGITDVARSRLASDLQAQARELVGEVMMFQLIQHGQVFLDSNDQHKLPSLYEEMVSRKRKEEVERERRLRQENEARDVIMEREIMEELRRQAELRDGVRNKRTSVHKQDEEEGRSSPSIRAASSSSLLSKMSPKLTQKVPSSQAISEAKMLAAITRGKLLGESSAGHSVHVGMDGRGELVAVYQWTLQCRAGKRPDTGVNTARRSKQVQSIQQEMNSLLWVDHKNLASYHSLTYKAEGDTIGVQLCMEYIHGSSLQQLILKERKNFPLDKVVLISRQVLDGLAYLHSNGVVHKDLRLPVVFLDATESVKVVGYSILRRLTDLHKSVNTQQKFPNGDEGTLPVALAMDQIGGKRGDLVKLGLLVLSLVKSEAVTSPPDKLASDLPNLLRDFIVKCLNTDTYRSLSFRDLLGHQFLQTTPTAGMSVAGVASNLQATHKTSDSPQDKFHFLGSPVLSQTCFPQPKSRLKSEFDELEHLGQGGFGDVIKVRNHLDDRIYAIKRIRLHPELKSTNRKIMREVKLLSQLNHENVVRYYNAWIESYSAEELALVSLLEEDEESLPPSTTSSVDGEGSSFSTTSGGRGGGQGVEPACSSSCSISGSSSSCGNSSSCGSSSEDDDDDSFISFAVSSATDTDPVVVFRDSSNNSTLSSLSGGGVEGGGAGEGEGEGGGMSAHSLEESSEMVFSMSPSEYKLDTKNILALIDQDRHSSDRSDPVIWHRSKSREGVDKMSRHPSIGPMQIRYLYIQMEFCENRTLRHLIDGGELHGDEDLLWRLLREISEGLNHIHQQGMIHRDLKPGNIFLDINGRVKIGDFGLATSYGFTRKASMVPPGDTSMVDYMGKQDFSGPVGTFLYTCPEILTPYFEGKFTQKVDIYSLGIIFFEMCNPPWTTEMERQIVLQDLRRNPPIFPASFEESRMRNKFDLLKQMLLYSPHKRPTAEEILQCELLPPKMEDEELLDVLTRTLSSTNSTSYLRLMRELFKQPVTRANEFAYFYDLQTVKYTLAQARLHQKIQNKIQTVFERHNAVHLTTPLLMPRSYHLREEESAAVLMDSSGGLVILPCELRMSLAKFVAMHDITDLRRYALERVYRESGVQKLNFTHPREALECAFDIVTGDTKELLPDAECIAVVWEVINEFPALKAQNYIIHLNHVSLLKAVLDFCSVTTEKQKDLLRIHHLLSIGGGNIEEVLSKELKITKLAATQLGKFVSCGMCLGEAKAMLEQLFRDKTSIGTLANQGWHEIETVVAHLSSMGISRDTVQVNVGMVQNVSLYCGLLFQFRKGQKRKHKKLILAAGGRYDRMISTFQFPSRSKNGRPIRGVGVSISEDHVYSVLSKAPLPTPSQLEVAPASPAGSCSGGGVLVHWLGLGSCSGECAKVASWLWRKGIHAQLFYSTADTVDELWTYCQHNGIPCLVVLVDRIYKDKNQIKVRHLENGRVLEKMVNSKDLVDYVLQKQKASFGRNTDTPDLTSSMSKPPFLSMNDLNSFQINFTVVSLQKVSSHIKRKVQDQAYYKVTPVIQKLKCRAEVLSVELDTEVLSSIVTTFNRQAELRESSAEVFKQVCERCPKANKKLVNKLLEEIHSLLVESKVPLVVLHSTENSSDQAHVLLNFWT